MMKKDLVENRIDKDALLSLYHVSKALNEITDLDTLLDRIMDLAIKTTNAERGFIMLKEGNELEIKVARNIDEKTIKKPAMLSRTIIDQVLSSGEAVLTSNALQDPRFEHSESVIMFKILSILGVPLTSREKSIGLLYVDARTQKNVFNESSMAYLTAFANLSGIAIENARLRQDLSSENVRLKMQVRLSGGYEDIIGNSAEMKKVMNLVHKVVDNNVPVLLQGESGTGKELIARTIHKLGSRHTHKFIAQYCGALPETLLESELFGYKKGAFTGAHADKPGLLEAAHKGTFFLDEIGEVPLSTQTKLLRFLEEGIIRRLGDTKERKINVRIISATNKNLDAEVSKGNFRDDLFYRLKVVKITLPPLRKRRKDIPLMVSYFLKQFEPEKEIKVTRDAMKKLTEYGWPGNIRELQNAISYAVVMSSGSRIGIDDLPPEILSKTPFPHIKYGMSISEMEQALIKMTLERHAGNRKETARILGISLRTLHNKIKEYHIKN
jgi:transcriptional regulator with GAF, ATPase, and Fis domain